MVTSKGMHAERERAVSTQSVDTRSTSFPRSAWEHCKDAPRPGFLLTLEHIGQPAQHRALPLSATAHGLGSRFPDASGQA